MGQQEEKHEATGPGAQEELDPFEQLAAALQSWTPDISGDKKNLWLKKFDINLQTWRPLELLIDWLKYRKSYDFANGFEGEFRQLYTEVHEFYEKLGQGAFTEDELFDIRIPELKDSAERLALYVVRVKAMCEHDAGIESDAGANTAETQLHKEAISEKPKRRRPAKAQMMQRNKAVAMAASGEKRASEFQAADRVCNTSEANVSGRSTVNIHNSNVILGGIHQPQSLSLGDHSSIGKETPAPAVIVASWLWRHVKALLYGIWKCK